MKTPIAQCLTLLTILALTSVELNAQPTRAGTNLNAKSITSTVLQLHGSDEVNRIRQLLVDGRKNDALEAAENYIEEVELTVLPHEKQRQYYAWNAYCTVLISHNRVEDAISACSRAMELQPERWPAVNNRGTAYFVGRMWDEALSDYQTALGLIGEGQDNVRETIEFNIGLLNERRGSMN